MALSTEEKIKKLEIKARNAYCEYQYYKNEWEDLKKQIAELKTNLVLDALKNSSKTKEELIKFLEEKKKKL